MTATKKPRAKKGKKEASKLGRPTGYDPSMCGQVIAFGKEGMEVVEMAVKLDVARSSLYKWAEEHPDFSDALARAREASEAFHAERIRKQAGLPSKETNLSAYLSYMGRRFKDWREKQELEHEVGDGLAEVLKMVDGKSRTLAQ